MSTLSALSTFKENQWVGGEQDAQQNEQDAQDAQGAHHFGVEHLEQDDGAAGAQFRAELKLLREANAKVYATRTPWKVKQ